MMLKTLMQLFFIDVVIQQNIAIIIQKTSGSLWQYYRDELALTNASAITNFHAANNSALFKTEKKLKGVTTAVGKKMLK